MMIDKKTVREQMRKKTRVEILMILLGMPLAYVGYYIAIRPGDWFYVRGSIPAIGVTLMFMGLLGIIIDTRKARRRRERTRERRDMRTSVPERQRS